MDITPKISIILPTYNGAKWIKRAIQSVLAQSFTDFELIIINDDSIDNTEGIIKSFSENETRIKYIKNKENLGVQRTLNEGLRETKGKYIARIDDDDEWIDKDKLKKQIDFLENNPDYVLVGTGAIIINEDGKELSRFLMPQNDEDIRGKILSKNCFIHSSVMFRKNIALNLGGYSEEKYTKHIEDYNLWLKLGTISKLANLPIYSVKFTLREGSISSINKLDQFRKNIILIKNYKNKYPNYIGAFIRSHIRLVAYSFILKFPIKFSLNKVIKFYKEN